MMVSDKLTICIPTFNSLSTIKIVLTSLTVQNFLPKIIILDNGSRDGTFEALCVMQKNHWFKKLNFDLRYFGDKVTMRKHQNLDMVRHRFCELVKTKYLMFIDSDVLIPPYCIISMLDHLERHPMLGMLALKVDPKANHVQLGASILRNELLANLEWRRTDTECQCRCVAKHILIQGFDVKDFLDTQARHLLAF